MPDQLKPPDEMTAEEAYAEALKRIEAAEREQATELELYDLPLRELPPEIGRLLYLETLRLSDKDGNSKVRLEYLPTEIVRLNKLQRLSLSQINLRQLPSEIVHLTQLKSLDLSQNDLTYLPSEVSQLTQLEALDLSQNNLKQLPSEIVQLEQLRLLGLSQNKLSQLLPTVGQLSQLQILFLSENYLDQLPSEITQLANLQILALSGNNISCLSPEIAQLTCLETLYLSKNNLSQLPSEIGYLTKLKELYLNENKLNQLPLEIVYLIQLEELNLSQNSLARFPLEICKLTQLKTLDLSQNNLRQLPSEIGHLSRLEDLDLSKNNLSQLPSEISQLPHLLALDLGRNNLNQFPLEICQLVQLQGLDLQQNTLSQLPSEIGQLKQLIVLDLQQNNLSELPSEISQLTELLELDLKENQKLLLPSEIINQVIEPVAIFEFWQQKMSQPHQALNEAKLVLVGQGGVGKTSLVQRLLHNDHNVDEAQTKGININQWPVPVTRQGQSVEIQLNIWDFGGQEIMHATHQFFLTKRSLYLLVLDARQGEQEGRVEYWLALINSFAGDSPILIVINKTDEHYLDLNRRGLQQKYPNIVGFVRTSARTGQGMDELKQAISRILAEMDHIDTPFPQNWYDIKQELERLQEKQNFLPYYEYQKLCQKYGIEHDSSQRVLISFLHDLGVLLNFQDDDRIRDTNILNPAWVTKGVYSLLTHPQLAQQGGVLPRQQLPQLLDATAYPLEVQGFILQMMEKFELAYPFEGGDRYLIPDLLPAEEPPFEWDEEWTLNFEYHYAVLPHSILHRFMVRQHTRIHKQDDGGQQVVWRTGVMLAYEGMLALIKADIEDKKMQISIGGSGQRRNFLSMLRFTFDSLHENITGTKPTEQVPIPGHPGVVVPYAHLLVLEENNIRQQILPGMSEMVDVQVLLGTIEEPTRRQFQGLTRQELLRLLREHFVNEELEAICFELGVEYEDLGGDTNLRKAMGLVSMMERTGRLGELVEVMGRERPFLFQGEGRRRPSVYR